jgi:hypothetical protein
MTPRGIRNNNFGNIEDGPFARGLPGYAGTDGRFARFATPDDGRNAHSELLGVYNRKHGINNISGVVGRWAPASDNNDVAAYAGYVAKQMGVDPNAPLDFSDPAIRTKLAQHMGEFENGPEAYRAAFSGQQGPMALAMAQSDPSRAGLPPEITAGRSAPAMSADSITGGPGILSADYDVGQRMVNAGAHLRDDPSALRVVDNAGKSKLQPIQGKDGSWYTFDPRTGALKPLMAGNPNAEAERAGAIAKAQAEAKQAVEQEAAKPKAIAHARMASEQAGDVIREATELADHPQLGNTTGVTGMVLRNIPGTQWHDLGQRIDTLGNKIQTGVLQSIREASANGASGFGTLTEKEGLVLRDLIASLKASQSEGQLRTNLRKIADWGARNRVNINDTLGQTYPELRQKKPDLSSFDK